MQDNPSALLAFPPQASWFDPTFSACYQAICYKTMGLRHYKSSYIFVYGVGLYSFFNNYDSTCQFTVSCDQNAAILEESEAIYIFALYSIGKQSLVQVDGYDLVPNGQTPNTFGQSFALFEFV
jgi:glucan 1,3-beta-glucosidase